MQRQQIRDLLKKKDSSRIDSFLTKPAKKKVQENQVLNFLQTWTHMLLYHKNIYPSDAFVRRDILGIQVYVASAPTLKKYLDEFFQKLRPQLPHLNHLQILILAPNNQIIQANTLHIDNLETDLSNEEKEGMERFAPSKLQKDIQVKSFLDSLNRRLAQGFVRRDETVSFKFRVGYRMEEQNSQKSNSLLEDWIKRQEIKDKATILTSLRLPSLNLLYQIIQ